MDLWVRTQRTFLCSHECVMPHGNKNNLTIPCINTRHARETSDSHRPLCCKTETSPMSPTWVFHLRLADWKHEIWKIWHGISHRHKSTSRPPKTAHRLFCACSSMVVHSPHRKRCARPQNVAHNLGCLEPRKQTLHLPVQSEVYEVSSNISAMDLPQKVTLSQNRGSGALSWLSCASPNVHLSLVALLYHWCGPHSLCVIVKVSIPNRPG